MNIFCIISFLGLNYDNICYICKIKTDDSTKSSVKFVNILKSRKEVQENEKKIVDATLNIK